VYAAFGILAGVLQVVAIAPYLRDVIGGATRPHRATWLIWWTLAMVVFASQRADGASWSLVLVGCQAASCTAIVVLSITRGVGGRTRVEAALLGVAALGVVGWVVADDPVIATASVVLADLVAVALMVPKTYRDPGSETLSTFVISTVSALCAVVSVGSLAPALLVYPGYLLVADGGVALLIATRRRALALTAGD
jgi:hypothetical protein